MNGVFQTNIAYSEPKTCLKWPKLYVQFYCKIPTAGEYRSNKYGMVCEILTKQTRSSVKGACLWLHATVVLGMLPEMPCTCSILVCIHLPTSTYISSE